MSQIAKLLLYQQKDSELLKIEQEIASSEEYKRYRQAVSFMDSASKKLDQLDARSKEILNRIDSLNASYEELAETLKDFDNLDELVESGADLSFYQRNASSISERLKALKAEIAALVTNAKETNEEFQTLKKKVIETQRSSAEISQAYKDFKTAKQKSKDEVTKELEKLAEGIDAEVLHKYKSKRSERIFPIICEIVNDRCSKCGIELSIADKDKMSSGKAVVECENCHRFLYKA